MVSLTNESPILDMSKATCASVDMTSTSKDCTISIPNVLPEEVLIVVNVYIRGPSTFCELPKSLAYIKSSCSGTYMECLYKGSKLMLYPNDVRKCLFHCSCISTPCDTVYVKIGKYSWDKEEEIVDICDIGITAPGHSYCIFSFHNPHLYV